MSNINKSKSASSGVLAPFEMPEERPDKIDYWFHKFMARNGSSPISVVRTFMDEDKFNDLRIAKIVRNKDVDQLRFIQARMQTWMLENCNYELGESIPDELDERLFYVRQLDDLLDMAIVGVAYNTSFYCLAAAEYNSMNSEVPGYQKEFLRNGFIRTCVAMVNNDVNYHDGTTAKDHTFPFFVISEFLSALIAFMQDLEMIEIQNPQAAAYHAS